MEASQRINLICELFNTNPKRLADDMGYDSPSTLYHVVNGHTKELSNKMVNSLLKLYPTLSKQFLLGLDDEPLHKEEVITASTAAMILDELADIKKMLAKILKDK